jgi:hypothetical protein
MAYAFHAIVELIPAMPSATRLFTAAGRVTGNAFARSRRWRIHWSFASLSHVSSRWLLEHEIASAKHQDDY